MPEEIKRGRRAGALLAVTLSTVVTFLVIEAAFRLFASEPLPPNKKDRPLAYYIPSKAPSLQDGEVLPKRSDTFRILVIGDSFTFGPYLEFNDTFPKKLESLLNLNASSKKIEVINRGVPGASTFTESIQAKNLMSLKPDLLILQIILNDAEPRLLTKKEKAELYDAPYLHWQIFRVWRSLAFFLGRIHNSLTVKRYIDYHTKFFKDPQTLGVFNESLERIKKLTDAVGVPMVAVTFPLFDFVINKNYPFKESHQIITKSLRDRGIQEISLRRSFAGIPPERLQVIPGEDSHPNEIAHRIAAEAILTYIVKHNLIPKQNIPQRLYHQRQHYQDVSEKDPLFWDKMYKKLFGRQNRS